MSSSAVVRKAWLQATTLLSQQSWCTAAKLQPCRTTVVVSRMFPPKQAKAQRAWGPFRPNIKKREWIYKLEAVRCSEPQGEMDLILTIDVEGIGFQGEQVTVSKRIGRNFLLPARVAEYVTEESLERWHDITKNLPETSKQSIWARKTMRKLSEMNLPIPMNPESSWTLNRIHVMVAFRKQGVELSRECILLPDEPITEHGDITFQVEVNKTDTVEVKGTIFRVDLDAPDQIPHNLPPIWGGPKLQLGETIRLALEKHKEGERQKQRQEASS